MPKRQDDVTVLAPIDELNEALKILNSNSKQIKKRKKPSLCLNDSTNYNMIVDKATLHICSLIKEAILKHKWRLVLKLLLAFTDQPRQESMSVTIIFKYTLIYLLNDPVAQANGTINQFLHLILSCQSKTDQHDLFKMLSTLPIDKKLSI